MIVAVYEMLFRKNIEGKYGGENPEAARRWRLTWDEEVKCSIELRRNVGTRMPPERTVVTNSTRYRKPLA